MIRFRMPGPSHDIRNAIILVSAFIISRLILILTMPLMLDEALYAVMITEQTHHLTLIPTFLGHFVSWKPAPFFWLYGILVTPLLSAGLPLELSMRLPSLLFGLLSLPPLYLVLRKAGASKWVAYMALFAFVFSGVSIYPQSTVLADAPLFFFMIASIYFYMDDRLGRWRFLAAGILAFIAFFIKLVFAFMPPALAIAWLYMNDRKSLRDPVFLLSLTFPFAAAVIVFSMLQGVGLANEFFLGNISDHLVSSSGIVGQINGIYNSVSIFFIFSPIFLGLFLVGLWKHWREHPFMAFWAAFLVIPLASNLTMPWYFLPVLPALSFFAVLPLVQQGKEEKIDLFLFFVMALLCIASLAFFYTIEFMQYPAFEPQKQAGILLAGKENVLIIGNYKPSIVAYKVETEDRSTGAALDFGWIDLQPATNVSVIATLVRDYHAPGYNITDGSFSGAFTATNNYRKDTNITHFDYIAFAGRGDYTPANSTLIYRDNLTNISIYKTD